VYVEVSTYNARIESSFYMYDVLHVKGGSCPSCVDASLAGDVDTRRSTTGYLFKSCGGPVSWQSRMQPSVELSSMESNGGECGSTRSHVDESANTTA
jgi:hypothetical protein